MYNTFICGHYVTPTYIISFKKNRKGVSNRIGFHFKFC